MQDSVASCAIPRTRLAGDLVPLGAALAISVSQHVEAGPVRKGNRIQAGGAVDSVTVQQQTLTSSD